MVRHGASRRQIARTLTAAYASGLLSEETFTFRIDRLLGRRLIDPASLIGDLSFRGRPGWRSWTSAARTTVAGWMASRRGRRELLLALDWTGGEQRELLIGRHHARIFFRDGGWVLQDLASTNGTTVNGSVVGRCVLRPGDHLRVGGERLRVD